MPGRRILLAARVGGESDVAGRTAAWLAADLGAGITVLYVAAELATVSEVAAGAGEDPASVRERMVEEARTLAHAWASALLPQGFEVRIEEGDVAERVAEVAAELGADLIVAGSQGRGAVQGMILGDNTRDILRHAPCPVVVVPPGARGHAAG